MSNNNEHDDDINMFPKIWGPSMWTVLHLISFSYPKNPSTIDKINYKKFYDSIGHILPCNYCRDSYNKFILEGNTKLDDNVFESRDKLTKWLYYVHEAVNKKLGVDYGVSYDDVVKKYEYFKTSCNLPQLSYNSKPLSCEIPSNNLAISYKMASIKDCPIIPYKIALHFINYAKKRNLENNEYYIINDYKINKYNKDWLKRNNECCNIINDMRINNIPAIETSGVWKGLPTISELKLIMRLSSTLSKDNLLNIIKLLPTNEKVFNKTYKLVK